MLKQLKEISGLWSMFVLILAGTNWINPMERINKRENYMNTVHVHDDIFLMFHSC